MKLLVAILLLLPFAALAQDGQGAFFPLGNASLALTASTSASTATALTQTEQPVWQEYVVNNGPQTAFLAFGGSAVAATTTSIPIPSGTTRLFTLNEGQAYVSAITATTTAGVYLVGGRAK